MRYELDRMDGNLNNDGEVLVVNFTIREPSCLEMPGFTIKHIRESRSITNFFYGPSHYLTTFFERQELTVTAS